MSSPNIYIELELFLDPAETDAGMLKSVLEAQISEWCKRINTPGSNNKQKVQTARAYLPKLKGMDLFRLAREATSERMKCLAADINNLRMGADINEDRFQKKLLPKYKTFFKEETIRRESGVKSTGKSTGKPVEKPERPVTLPAETISFADMENIAKDLAAVSGHPKDFYVLLGLSQMTDRKDLLKKSQDENEKNRRQTNKTVEVDAKNRLYGKCITYFKSDQERKKYDAALKRFPFDEKAKSAFELRCDTGKVTPLAYHTSVQDTLVLGYTPDEAAFLVWDYYINKKKCPVPDTYVPVSTNGTAVGGSLSPTFNSWLGKLIQLIANSKDFNTAPFNTELASVQKKLIEFRGGHFSEIQIQGEIMPLFRNLESLQRKNKTRTLKFCPIHWNNYLVLDVTTLEDADNYSALSSLATFHQELLTLLQSIQ